MAKWYGSDEELDRRLRASLDPPPATAVRIARKALEDARPATRRAWPRLAAGGAGVVAIVLVMLILVRVVLWRRGAEPIGEAPVSEARYTITNRDGLLVVRSLDGGATFLRAGERTRESPLGKFLIVRGGSRP